MKKEMWLIWKNPKNQKKYKIGVLKYENNQYEFFYVNPELNVALEEGFCYFPGFENINQVYKSGELFANIETRLPNTSRADYLEILNSYGLDANSSKMEILRATKGRLITDNYECVPAFDYNIIEFDVAGTIGCPDIEKCQSLIEVNSRLLLEVESKNGSNEALIKVLFYKNGIKYHLGYVPRYYSKDLAALLERGTKYSAMVQELNFECYFNDEDIIGVKVIFEN